MYTSHSEIVFSVTASNTNLHVQTHEYNLITDFLDVNIALLNEKIKIYKL